MMGARFGIVALIPAMFNLTVVTGGNTISMQICTGDGQVHTVQVPVGGSGSGGQDGKGLCCAKGCHAGNSRKRTTQKN